MRLHAVPLAVAMAVAWPSADRAAEAAPAVAWLEAAGDAQVDAAFAQARAGRKPVLLYWGARWCPPCNQLKATLFNRQDFIERSRSFVPVHVDGDLPGAQKLGARFKVRGYPTMILFSPEGAEITRLPGEADAPQVLAVLEAGLSGGRSAKAVLADARAGKALTPAEWRMLAFYSWDTDEQQLVPEKERPPLLLALAAACPASETEAGTRLWLKALAAAGEEGASAAAFKPDAAARERMARLLSDPAASRAQMDTLTGASTELTRALFPNKTPGRTTLVEAFDAALRRLQRDATLSRADRITALYARVELARLELPDDAKSPRLPAALVQDVKAEAERADREITDGYERQAVVTTAAHVLERAGLMRDSDALLEANLARSHSPYYLMSALGANARKRGDKAEALRWYRQAFEKSEGLATRLQWGAGYVNALVDLAPHDEARIEGAASRVLAEASSQPNVFYERSARSLQRMGRKLLEWNAGNAHAAALSRLQAQLAALCGKLDPADPQRAACTAVLQPCP